MNLDDNMRNYLADCIIEFSEQSALSMVLQELTALHFSI